MSFARCVQGPLDKSSLNKPQAVNPLLGLIDVLQDAICQATDCHIHVQESEFHEDS